MTESGLRLRLVAPSAEESIAAVRALSEGHGPKRVLRTIPVIPFTAPVARATVAWDAPLIQKPAATKNGRNDIKGCLQAFRGTQPGQFEAKDFAAFAGIDPDAVANNLIAHVRNGTLQRIGKNGRNILYRFTTA